MDTAERPLDMLDGRPKHNDFAAIWGHWFWAGWFAKHSVDLRKRPAMGVPAKGCPVLGDTPGTYVFEQ